MSDQEKLQLIQHWSLAASASGRARLHSRYVAKRALWLAVTLSTFATKRLLDIVVSATALLVLAPLLALTAALIKLEDGGPVFFRQQRVGRGGHPFGMWKFRSMVPNADRLKDQLLAANENAGGVTFKMRHDPRITRIGRFIRKYSVDELPQFWNVLRGDMALVGPRPPVPREVSIYSVADRQRLVVKPGLTCFWQVGGRANIGFDDQVKLDLDYIRSENLWLDCQLLLRTVPAVLFGKGAF